MRQISRRCWLGDVEGESWGSSSGSRQRRRGAGGGEKSLRRAGEALGSMLLQSAGGRGVKRQLLLVNCKWPFDGVNGVCAASLIRDRDLPFSVLLWEEARRDLLLR